MRPPLLACLLLLLAAAVVVPQAGAVRAQRKPGAAGKVQYPAKPTPPIVKAMCAKADDPKFCEASIAKQPPLPGGKKLDGAGVLQLAMNALRGKAAEAKKVATALAADPKTAKLAVGPLNDCVDMYDDIPYSLHQAEKAIADGDKYTTNTMLDACDTDVDTCEQGFEEREELEPLMVKHDAELGKLASNCLAIADAAGLIPPAS